MIEHRKTDSMINIFASIAVVSLLSSIISDFRHFLTICEKDVPRVEYAYEYEITGGAIIYGGWDNSVCRNPTVTDKTPSLVVKLNIPL
jgi:hypothetical protein